MKPEEYRMGDAIRVFWEDSSHSGGWRYPKHDGSPVRIEDVCSLGFFVNSDERGLNLTTSISYRGGVLTLVSIPWSCIRAIQRIPDFDFDMGLPVSGNALLLDGIP